MLRFFVLRFVLPLVLFLVVRAVLKSVWGSWNNASVTPRGKGDAANTRAAGGELKKDPVCGMYVAAATSVSKTVNGRELFFCSAACRDKYTPA